MGEPGADGPTYKVEKVIERYDLEGMGDRLERHWLGADGESRSLRHLADDFNGAVLRAALRSVGEQPLDGEVETMYRTLAGDDTSSGDRTQARRTLDRAGVDVDRLERDFVTHQAVHTYLTKGRGVRKETEAADPRESARVTVQRLKSRLAAVTETTLSQLRSGSVISLGEFDVIVSVDVACSDCGAHKQVTELLDERGCDCDG